MKKKLFLFATAALVLASCNNDVTISENTALEGSNVQKEIALSPYAKTPKREPSATTPAVEGTEFPDGLTMQVAAYAMPISSSWAAGGYFDKTAFNGDNDHNWKGGRYWPLSDAYVTFLAVAGVDAEDVTFAASTFASGATVTYDAASFTAQTDLMYSGKQAAVTKSGNTLVFPADVDMTFKHALAWLQFNVRAASADYDEKFGITKIEIAGANKTGTFTIDNANYNTPATDPTTTGTWDDFAAGAAYDVPSSTIAAGEVTTAYKACGKALLVPKPDAAAFTKFTIYYTLDGKAFTFDYTPISTVLAQATKYVYNITFKLTEIEIDPVVEPWTERDTTLVYVPTFAYKEGAVAGTYEVSKFAGHYSVTIPGCATGVTYDVSEPVDTDWLDETNNTYASHAGSYTADASGNLTIYFTVEANASTARSANIVLTEHEGTNNTKVTISQASGL